MKRMHIHVGVENLDDAIRFYSALFGVEPNKTREDYAKWMLDDPRVNFAISTRARLGVDHLGLQVEEAHELEGLREQMKNADMSLFDEGRRFAVTPAPISPGLLTPLESHGKPTRAWRM